MTGRRHNLKWLTIAVSAFALTVDVAFGTESSKQSIDAGTQPLSMRLAAPTKPSAAGFRMGTATSPHGSRIEVDSCCLLYNGKRWMPIMGEFHFARYPASEWRDELAKMKRGGIDIVATYVFWIHHEELEGEWDWSGDRNLREFLQAADEAGLKAIVRCGPWCHGEVRNGGTPDWVLKKGWQVRDNDPQYLAATQRLYEQIARQLNGLLWKDGGPVIGIQLENEYQGPAEHLLRLKEIAREVGLDVPLYTRTGWTETRTPLPFGEILPLHGAYAEGFWDRSLEPMPGEYWKAFRFDAARDDENIANEALAAEDADDRAAAGTYPFLTCEIGGGMMSAYHRRIRIDPRDVEATTLVKIGSGSNSPGYYMYHGGVNPEGKLTTLMETQDGMWNDLPVKNYDFQAPLGQYGQVRPHYQRLRRLHHLLHDFGPELAAMPATLPTTLPTTLPNRKDDLETLRWAVRSDGRRGFVFINNFERGSALPEKTNVQFQLTLANGESLTLPDSPVVVPSGECFIWPFNWELGPSTTLAWATAQPVCFTDVAGGRTYFFAAIPGVEAEFAVIAGGNRAPEVRRVQPGREAFWTLDDGDRTIQLVLLNDDDSLYLRKDELGVVWFEQSPPEPRIVAVDAKLIQAVGPRRDIPLGKANKPVAAAPSDPDFEHAAIWEIPLPDDIDFAAKPLLRLHYVGDVARVLIDGNLVVDDFYNGDVLEIGLWRYADGLGDGELTVQILPLRADAPIGFSPPTMRPQLAPGAQIAELRRAELVLPTATMPSD